MPSILSVFGYKIYFWTNENNEPVHVHVCKGKPSANATKIWITQMGGVISINSSRIPKNDLIKLEKYIEANAQYICQRWFNYFGYLTYYC